MLLKIRAWHGKELPGLSNPVSCFHQLSYTLLSSYRLHMKCIWFEGLFPSAVFVEMFRYKWVFLVWDKKSLPYLIVAFMEHEIQFSLNTANEVKIISITYQLNEVHTFIALLQNLPPSERKYNNIYNCSIPFLSGF